MSTFTFERRLDARLLMAVIATGTQWALYMNVCLAVVIVLCVIRMLKRRVK